MRRTVQRFVDRSFRRERRYIGSVVVGIAPASVGRDVAYDCRLTIWSHFLGLIVVSASGDTIRTAVQQATLRSREVLRRRLAKRRSKTRRVARDRLDRWLPRLAVE